LYLFLFSPSCPTYPILLDLTALKIFGYEKSCSSSQGNFLYPPVTFSLLGFSSAPLNSFSLCSFLNISN
jgi:hypothetical protein